MSRLPIVLSAVLFFLLIGTNLWWFYGAVDQAATQKYSDQMLYECRHELDALKGVCLELTFDSTKDDVLRVLNLIQPDCEPFEKHGLLNGCWLSFRFDPDGNLSEVLTSGDFSTAVTEGWGH